MTKPYDRDLRVRVVSAIEAGETTQAAAERYGIGKATAGAWARLKRKTGDVTPARLGKPTGSKLDPHTDFIFGLVDETIDISLAEIAHKLHAERGVRAVPATIWYFFARHDWTFKKRRPTPASRTEATLRRRARNGLTGKSISTRSV